MLNPMKTHIKPKSSASENQNQHFRSVTSEKKERTSPPVGVIWTNQLEESVGRRNLTETTSWCSVWIDEVPSTRGTDVVRHVCPARLASGRVKLDQLDRGTDDYEQNLFRKYIEELVFGEKRTHRRYWLWLWPTFLLPSKWMEKPDTCQDQNISSKHVVRQKIKLYMKILRETSEKENGLVWEPLKSNVKRCEPESRHNGRSSKCTTENETKWEQQLSDVPSRFSRFYSCHNEVGECGGEQHKGYNE